MTLCVVVLARGAGHHLWPLGQDLVALLGDGDRLILCDDGGRADDTPAWAARVAAMLPWVPGVTVTRLATGTPGAGDLGLAANLALRAAGGGQALILPGRARLDGAAFAAARTQARAQPLLHAALRLTAPGTGAALEALSTPPWGLFLPLPAPPWDEGLPEGSELAFLAALLPGGEAGGQTGGQTGGLAALPRTAPLGRMPRPPGPGPALAARIADHPLALPLLTARLPGAAPGECGALAGPALPRTWLREQARLPMPETVSRAPLRLHLTGRHRKRSPFSYPALAPLWQDWAVLTDDPATADVIVHSHPQDPLTLDPAIARANDRAGNRTHLLLSEEPFWDTLFSPDPLAATVRLPAAHLGSLAAHQLNHHNAALFDFDLLPFFTLTDPAYAARYGQMFTRNAALTPQDWARAFAARPVNAAFMAERRPEAFHDMAFPGGNVIGLCAWRTRLAEGYASGRVERIGASWHGGPTRFDLTDWHADKLTRMDGQTRMLSAIENTHQPTYLSEKLFDAFACGARPLYLASPGHRAHDLGLPPSAWINLWGLDSAAAAATAIDAAAWDGDFCAAYAAAQGALARLWTDPALIAAEHARMRRALRQALAAVAAAGPAQSPA